MSDFFYNFFLERKKVLNWCYFCIGVILKKISHPPGSNPKEKKVATLVEYKDGASS